MCFLDVKVDCLLNTTKMFATNDKPEKSDFLNKTKTSREQRAHEKKRDAAAKTIQVESI